MQSDAVAPDASTPGRVLASAREAAGLSVAEVAARLKYSTRQIEAIEADQYHALPPAPIARGMIRGYAKLVGIDPAPLLEHVGAQLNRGPETVQPANMDVPFQTAPRRGSWLYVLFSIVVLLAVVAVAVEWFLPAKTPAPTVSPTAPAASTPAPAPAAPEAVAPPPAAEVPPVETTPEPPVVAPKRIELFFQGECWVEVRDASGKLLYSQTEGAGTQRRVEGVPPLAVVVGNTDGVRIRYDDADVDLAPHARGGVARITLK